MHFWKNNTAAPTLFDTYFTKPGFMREGLPKQISSIVYDSDNNIIGSIYRLTKDNSISVAAFLEYNYNGDDWKLSNVIEWIDKYLMDPYTLVLGVISPSDVLLGTIFSVPVSSGTTKIDTGHELSHKSLRIIEGLCIDSSLRGKGIAGHLISSIDYQTSLLFGNCVHLWSRELPELPSPYFNTAINTATYAYKRCIEVDYPTDLKSVSWPTFVKLWNIMYDDFEEEEGSYIISKISTNTRRGGISVFTSGDNKIVVVSDTCRTTTNTGIPHKSLNNINVPQKIYEVIWCGKLVTTSLGTRLFPSVANDSYKHIINKITHKLNGILFVSTALNGGCAKADWRTDGWHFGTSGHHCWYIYNFIVSAFGLVRLHIIHEEL